MPGQRIEAMQAQQWTAWQPVAQRRHLAVAQSPRSPELWKARQWMRQGGTNRLVDDVTAPSALQSTVRGRREAALLSRQDRSVSAPALPRYRKPSGGNAAR